MCKQDKSKQHLRLSSQQKLNCVLQELKDGKDSRKLSCRKLYHRCKNISCFSLRLSKGDRAIVVRNQDFGIKVLFVGTHAEYNKFVGPNQKMRLGRSPWQ